MKKDRLIELLAYAHICFNKCTNPFETIHLTKKNISADECKDLSQIIAQLIEDSTILQFTDADQWFQEIDKAEKEFEETQQ